MEDKSAKVEQAVYSTEMTSPSVGLFDSHLFRVSIFNYYFHTIIVFIINKHNWYTN